MTGPVFIQLDGLTDFQRAVRDHFRQGGSVTSVLFVLAGIIGVVLLVRLLTHYQKRTERSPEIDQPQELFTNLLAGLELTRRQQRLLAGVAQELGLENPSVILLCPALFDRYVRQWRERSGGQGPTPDQPVDDRFIAQVRVHLFPPALSRIGTRQLGL